MKYKGFNRIFFIFSIVALVVVVAFVAVVDPFIHYHKPLFGDNAFASEQKYSMYWIGGRMKHYQGDSIIVGSSLSNNVSIQRLDEVYGGTTLNAKKASGRPNIYTMFIDEASANNDLKYIFYELNFLHLDTDYTGTIPDYLYNSNPFDDVYYVLNKDVVFEGVRVLSELDDGEAADDLVEKAANLEPPVKNPYNLGRLAGSYYLRPSSLPGPDKIEEYYRDAIQRVEENILPDLEANPDAKFIFFVPPISILPAYDVARLDPDIENGYIPSYKKIVRMLLAYDNVEIHMFMDMDGYNDDMNEYMDPQHYSKPGGELVVEGLRTGDYRLTEDNLDERFAHWQQMALDFEIPFLKRRFIGEDVRELQRQLQALGYEIEANGDFSDETEQAVVAFQTEHGLEPTGIAMPETRQLIAELAGQG